MPALHLGKIEQQLFLLFCEGAVAELLPPDFQLIPNEHGRQIADPLSFVA